MPKHLHSLDYLRGFAAISVCLFHFTQKPNYLPTSDLLVQLCSVGHYGVEVFFIISGLVIPYSMKKGRYTLQKIWIFLKKRMVRIEPPYLISILLALALNYATTLSPGYAGNPFHIDYLQLLYHVGYLNAFMGMEWYNPVCWTLAVELQYYLLIAFIFPLINHRKTLVWVGTLVVFNALAPFFNLLYVFHFAPYFTAGILLYRYLMNRLTISEASLLAIPVLIILYFQFGYKEIIVVGITCLFILLPLPKTTASIFLGNISFSLYLLHYPIGLRVINLTLRFIENITLRHLMVLAALAVSILASWIYFLYVEKPFKEWSHRISYKKTKSSKQLDTLEEPINS